MNLWRWFWVLCLLVAGPAFACITAVVTVRGFQDLRDMFRSLAQPPSQSGNTPNES
jgi:hypothetical protein